ncbi:hypothetical protein RUM43_006142 [Polyplax serrata]|uniref:Uncharacterized protein n=1 Tax=Polyplax serrata TaxID=468196 RepID=A0AAN8P0Y8_POLSC
MTLLASQTSNRSLLFGLRAFVKPTVGVLADGVGVVFKKVTTFYDSGGSDSVEDKSSVKRKYSTTTRKSKSVEKLKFSIVELIKISRRRRRRKRIRKCRNVSARAGENCGGRMKEGGENPNGKQMENSERRGKYLEDDASGLYDDDDDINSASVLRRLQEKTRNKIKNWKNNIREFTTVQRGNDSDEPGNGSVKFVMK